MKNVFIYLAAAVVFSFSCKKNALLTPSVSNTTIQVNKQKGATLNIPYADTAELKQYSSNKEILHYGLAKKIALLELQESGFVTDMLWEGYHLSEVPVLILDLNNIPKYYDYIALNTQRQPIGFVRVYAARETSSIIERISKTIPDYASFLTKFGNNSAFYADWSGHTYVGIKSKSGATPIAITDPQTGKSLPKEQIKVLKGQAIIDFASERILPFIANMKQIGIIGENELKDGDEKALLANPKIQILLKKVKSELQTAWQEEQAMTQSYWEDIDPVLDSIATIPEEEITANTKFFGRFFRWVKRKFDPRIKEVFAHKFGHPNENNGNNPTINFLKNYREAIGNGWCGPYICGLIQCIVDNISDDWRMREEYRFFENRTNITPFSRRVKRWAELLRGGEQKPMLPEDMDQAMIERGGRVGISIGLYFRDKRAWEQLNNNRRPVFRLCIEGGELHWTLIYGAKIKERDAWMAEYWFHQADNGTVNGEQGFTTFKKSNFTDYYFPINY